MCMASAHTEWLVDTSKRLKTADGMDVEVWEFRHEKDEAVLSAWAKYFRNHYCLDSDIDSLRGNRTRQDYLTNIKFPCKTSKLGPGVRAGDFGEILVSDYLQWRLDYWVPRVRWSSKVVRDESPKGSDVIGFRFHNKDGITSTKDVLFVFESKTKFSASKINRKHPADMKKARGPSKNGVTYSLEDILRPSSRSIASGASVQMIALKTAHSAARWDSMVSSAALSLLSSAENSASTIGISDMGKS